MSKALFEYVTKGIKNHKGKEVFPSVLMKKRKRNVVELKRRISEIQNEINKSNSREERDLLVEGKRRLEKEIEHESRKDNFSDLDFMDYIYSLKKTLEKRYRFSEKSVSLETQNEKEKKFQKWMNSIMWLLKRKILHPNSEVMKTQLEGLSFWINELKNICDLRSGEDQLFAYFVLNSVLLHDIHWKKRMNRSTRKGFPSFDSYSSGVLGQIKDLIFYHTKLSGRKINEDYSLELNFYNRIIQDDLNLKKALEERDFRVMYLILRRRAEIEKQKKESAEIIEGSGKWLPVFSFFDKEGFVVSSDKKLEIATRLSELANNSDDMCLKGITVSKNYLEKGDIHAYTVTVKIKVEVGKSEDGESIYEDLFLEVPEIVFLVLHDKNEIDIDEVHGNGVNQTIKPEYISIAKEYILDPNHSFSGTMEAEIRLSDTEMFNNVQTKVENLILGKGEDLDERELRFLYQVYRSVFGLGQYDRLRLDVIDLNKKRRKYLTQKQFGEHNVESDILQRKKDFARIYECKIEEVVLLGQENLEYLKNQPKVLVHNEDKDIFLLLQKYRDKFKNVEIFVGEVKSTDVKFLPKLRKIDGSITLVHLEKNEVLDQIVNINGILLTPEDRSQMLKLIEHPPNLVSRKFAFRAKIVCY